MGVTIYANGSSRSFDMGGGGFFSLRKNICLSFDKELGEHYSLMPSCFRNWEEYDKVTERILSSPRFTEEDIDVIEFLFASDCGGEVGYKTCKKIYEIIKDVDFEGKIFTYAAYSDGKDYEHFKEFLLECYKKRRKMRWS